MATKITNAPSAVLADDGIPELATPAWPPTPRPPADTALVQVIHQGRVKLARLCDLIDPAMDRQGQ